MEVTRIDLKVNGNKWTFDAFPKVSLISHGKWEIDNILGKTLCRIEIEGSVKNESFYLDFIPSDDFIFSILANFLEAEYKNDQFIFLNPVIEDKRPSQFKNKLESLLNILKPWINMYLKPAEQQGRLFKF